MAPAFKPIDWEKFELYLKAGSTQKKIAESFGLEPDTLRSRVKKKYKVDYTTLAASLCSTGELLIEATQFQKALSGNIQMLMWLGKIRCGQREPDLVSAIPVNQNEIDRDHHIMELEHKLAELQSNGYKPQTE